MVWQYVFASVDFTNNVKRYFQKMEAPCDSLVTFVPSCSRNSEKELYYVITKSLFPFKSSTLRKKIQYNRVSQCIIRNVSGLNIQGKGLFCFETT